MSLKIQHFKEVSSTMDVARDLVLSGEGHPDTIILADQQTGGRGRFNRNWVSPVGNLHMSMITGDVPLSLLSQFALMWGVVLRECLSKYVSGQLQCKWPNDILLEGKKVAGILIERVQNALIVGVGVNIVVAPENVMFPATCLANVGENSPSHVGLAKDIGETYLTKSQLEFDIIHKNWLENAWRLGEEINIRQGERSVVGIFETIDEIGALILKDHPQKYYTGDVFMGDK